ncbi:DUF397 domain-containing protein [Kitasatospora sp. NPDC059327]|uniref:DUF397 domain-containing protein n=1 Tax=Kitasatospora sp. NPDC059327 TaxID=3346803 RepID=UPI0036CF0533
MSSWQKSSYSGESNECIEVRTAEGMVELRESETYDVIIRTTPRKWVAFLLGVKAGEFDHFGS